MKNNREPYIDIVKGLSIICIVFLHYESATLLPRCINTFIGSFMITSFYVTSGWVSAMNPTQRSIRELIKKRWKQLGIPYLWWTAIILIFDFILWGFGYYDMQYVGKEIYKTITLRGIGTLWFLPALFGGEIIWHWIKSKKKIWILLIAIILTICYQHFYNKIFAGHTEIIYLIYNAPFRSLKNMLEAWPCIAFGYFFYKHLMRDSLKLSKLALTTIGICICMIAFILINYLPVSFIPYRGVFSNFCSPIGLLLIAKSLQNVKILKFFNFWGINSLNLMVTHYSIILVLFTIVIEQGFKIPFKGWTTLICFLLSMPFQYLLVTLINKYAKFTLGK